MTRLARGLVQCIFKNSATFFDPTNFRTAQKNINELMRSKQYDKAKDLLDSIEKNLTEAPKVWAQQKRRELNTKQQSASPEEPMKPISFR